MKTLKRNISKSITLKVSTKDGCFFVLKSGLNVCETYNYGVALTKFNELTKPTLSEWDEKADYAEWLYRNTFKLEA